MKERYFFSFTVFLALLITSIGWPELARAAESVSITHTVKSYVSDGPVTTITLTLQVQNNSGAAMNDVVIRPVPMPKDMLFMGAMDIESLPMENIAVGANISADYAIIGHIMLPQEVIMSMPIFWEVRYVDGSGQKINILAVSGVLTDGDGL